MTPRYPDGSIGLHLFPRMWLRALDLCRRSVQSKGQHNVVIAFPQKRLPPQKRLSLCRAPGIAPSGRPPFRAATSTRRQSLALMCASSPLVSQQSKGVFRTRPFKGGCVSHFYDFFCAFFTLPTHFFDHRQFFPPKIYFFLKLAFPHNSVQSL